MWISIFKYYKYLTPTSQIKTEYSKPILVNTDKKKDIK